MFSSTPDSAVKFASKIVERALQDIGAGIKVSGTQSILVGTFILLVLMSGDALAAIG